MAILSVLWYNRSMNVGPVSGSESGGGMPNPHERKKLLNLQRQKKKTSPGKIAEDTKKKIHRSLSADESIGQNLDTEA